jgi:hypothetical protein
MFFLRQTLVNCIMLAVATIAVARPVTTVRHEEITHYTSVLTTDGRSPYLFVDMLRQAPHYILSSLQMPSTSQATSRVQPMFWSSVAAGDSTQISLDNQDFKFIDHSLGKIKMFFLMVMVSDSAPNAHLWGIINVDWMHVVHDPRREQPTLTSRPSEKGFEPAADNAY